MIKINHKSDFKIKEKPTTVALEVPFIFSYYVFESKKYVASFDGSKYVNCERKEDGSLDVIFNNPGFGIGHLKVERKYAINDKAFSDGVYDVVSVDKTDVFITSGKTLENYVETLVVPPYLKGDKGDPMTWKTMTDGEREELVKDVVEAIGIDFDHTGDGKKFLSDDGTYKEIEASEYDDAELRNKIEENAKNIADNKTNVDKEISNLVTKSELESTDAKANRAISEASIAKNAVATLEGLANADEAMQTLASQVVQIEENKQKISELGSGLKDLSSSLSLVINAEIIDFAEEMPWEVTFNNYKNTTNYISKVEKGSGGSVELFPSVGGVNMSIATYIGTPSVGGVVEVTLSNLESLNYPKIVKGVTSTNSGIEIQELTETNGSWTGKVLSTGEPLYLQLFVMWSASATKPAKIGKCNIQYTNVTYVENFATKEDLIKENLAIIPKAEKSYNPGSGILESYNGRYGTGLVRVKEGMILYFDAPKDCHLILFDKKQNYIKNQKPWIEYLMYGYYKVEKDVEYIAITCTTDFDKICLKKVEEWDVITTLEYDTDRRTTRSKLSKFLRKNGAIINYTENGKNVLEIFYNSLGRDTLEDNFFQNDENWKEFANTETLKGVQPSPMKGKTFYSIGDSHRWKWLKKLSELTGGISGGDIFSAAFTAYEKYYVSRTVAMAKYIVDLYKSGKPVDYIFMEYGHKYFVNNMEPANWYHYSGDITEAEPFLTQAYYDYTQKIFNNTSEAESFWNDNFATIVGGFTPKSNAIIALKTGVKVQSPKFKLSGSATTSGNFTIKFTDNSGELHQTSIAIPSGLSINEALTIVNEIEFSDSGSKWDNLSAHNTITDATIKFTYNGNLNDADASIKLGFDFGTTGIVYDGDWTINAETKDWIRGFKSHDVSKWEYKEKWNGLWANADAYIWIKAAVELLQREIPQAKIFVWTLNTEAWNYNTNTIGGKSVLYPDGMLNVQAIYDSDKHKIMLQNLEGWEKVAKYYHLGFIPISEMNSISPANLKYYYPSDDVHPTQEGYDRVAEILAANVY